MARRVIELTVKVSVAPGVTKAMAKRELRTRVNEACVYGGFKTNGEYLEDEDVRVRKVT